MTEFAKIPVGAERWDNNEPVVVLRPVNQTMTLSLAKIAVEHQNEEALKEAISGSPCKFLGYLKREPDGKMVAVDENGENAVAIEPGDIFAEPANLRRPE